MAHRNTHVNDNNKMTKKEEKEGEKRERSY